MHDYQREFFDFVIASGALRFGEFTLKSGRSSPYFFNAGQFDTGQAISHLSRHYAAAIEESDIAYDVLFGPAYKGIPLAVATSMALYDLYRYDMPFAFNRKEIKDHGEGGRLVGAPLEGRILVIDDVISAGTSVRESFDIISAEGAEMAGVVIALDRQERGIGERSAIQEIEEQYGIPVIHIVCLADLIEYLHERGDMPEILDAILAYQRRYGAD